ncbi:MAG: hypothetical protein ITD36_03985 [Nitrospira sp.]|nr:hypothetical protein [Nitrospira sp.]MBP0124334.1 hypothetical protein [Nitrospira sp.]MBP0130769.1 hypothetical protein [Nitrospira sp.]
MASMQGVVLTINLQATFVGLSRHVPPIPLKPPPIA